jgi:hypothetical protein
MRKLCLICREVQYYILGEDLTQCRACGSGTFGPGSSALRSGRGWELTEADRITLRVNRIDPQED